MKKTLRVIVLGSLAFWACCTSKEKTEPPPTKEEKLLEEQPTGSTASKVENPFAAYTPTLVGQHQKACLHVGFSPDGKTLVSTSKDQTIRLWPFKNEGSEKILRGHTQDVMMAKFSSDGRWLVSASWDETARIWDVASGKQKKVLKDKPRKTKGLSEEELQAQAALPPPHINWATFSSDGRQVITAGDDFSLKLWDMASGKKLLTFEDPGCRQRQVFPRPDAKGWVSSAGCMDDGVTYLKFWDPDGTLANTQGDEDHDTHYLAFDRGKKWIVGADGSISFSVFSAQGSLLKRVMVGTYHFALAFGLDDQHFLVGTLAGDILVYQTSSWERLGKISIGEKEAVETLAVNPIDGTLVAGLRNGKVVKFDNPIR